MSPRTGRPTDSPKTQPISVSFDEKTLQILDDYCKKNELKRTEGIREAVKLLAKEK